MKRVFLLYPTRRREYCGEVEKFNPYYFGCRVYDEERKDYYLRLGKGTLLLCKDDGFTYRLTEDFPQKEGVIWRNVKGVDNPIWYDFLEGKIEDNYLKRVNFCKVVSYSKRNNSLLREKFRDFPTIEEIKKFTESNSCENTTKMLIKYISN